MKNGGAASISGWAADVGAGAPAEKVLVFSHGRLIGWAHPSITRFDVTGALQEIRGSSTRDSRSWCRRRTWARSRSSPSRMAVHRFSRIAFTRDDGAAMPVAIVTGSGGLVGSESVRHFVEAGFDVIGVDNDMRAYFFGESASTEPQTRKLEEAYPGEFRCARSGHSGRRRRRQALPCACGAARARHPRRRPAVARLGRVGTA